MFEGKDALFEYFLTSEEMFSLFLSVLSKMKVSKDEKSLVDWVISFKEQNRRVPSLKELEVRKGSIVYKGGVEDKIMFQEVVAFLKNERVKEWIITVAERLSYGGIKVEELFAQARDVVEEFVSKEGKMKSFMDIVTPVIDRIVAPAEGERIPTGIKGLDKVLFGGVGRGEFLCLIAPPGRGKTMFLINLAYGGLVHRKKVLFVSLELSQEVIVGRFARRIAKQSRKDIRVDVEKTKDLLRRFGSVAEDLIVVYSKPHVLSVDELGVMVDRVKRQFGGLDLIAIDYFDRMKLPSKDYRLGYGFLIDYLRDLALDKNVAIASATQANRMSLSAMVVTEEHVGESFKKVENSDIVLSVNRSQQDTGKNAGRLVILKNREYGNVGAQIPVYIDFDQALIADFGK